RYGVSGSARPQSEENHPVLHVSWNDAVAYCKWLSAKTGKHFRLPTDAEREYACRAGTRTAFNTGENITMQQANFIDDQNQWRRGTVPVDSFEPNAWGLYNMHGNVFEWCSDWYGGTYYDDCKAKGTVSNPQGPATGSFRVIRSGSWLSYAELCRSAYRSYGTPDNRNDDVGFRLVFVP
ncbi:MAG: formylglycine-generating enzyme family protein, partial [Geobacteraceae bacterium]|nr:formylglycine-generating enzyme family protein [Geobacteraceae bacterium]